MNSFLKKDLIGILFLVTIISVAIINYEKALSIMFPKQEHYTIFKYEEPVEIQITSNDPLDKHIRDMCLKYEVEYELAVSILEVENPIRNPRAINHNRDGTKDLGLWQLNTSWLGENGYEWWDPFDNTTIAIIHLQWLTHLEPKLNKWQIAAAYNCGYSRVLKNTIPAMSVAYANKAMSYYENL